MGRELKRVPINFDWCIRKIWKGYTNPYPINRCVDCDGGGGSPEYRELENELFSFDKEVRKPNPFKKGSTYNSIAWINNLTDDDVKALIDANRLWDFTRVPINDEQREIVKKKIEGGGNDWLPFDNGYIPTAKEVNEWNLSGAGHDAGNCCIIIKAKLKKLGKPVFCTTCNGDGVIWESKEAKALHENWEGYEPPIGKGFQLWNTTGDGCPFSPVFESLELLCEYLEKEKVSFFGENTATKEKWYEILKDGLVYYEKGNAIYI